MATKWGILSAGKISHDFVSALITLPSEEHQVLGIAARNLDSAKKFASTHNIPNAYDSYEKLLQNKDIEVVYIGSINPQHLPLIKLSMDHGKHVLCEKPLCINVKETKQVLEYAKQKKLFLMEAVWSRFFPVYEELKSSIENGDIGEPQNVNVTFGVPIDAVERLKMKDLGGGSVLDIGVYCVQLISYVFGGENPLKVVAAGQLNEEGVDEVVGATLIYPGGKIGVLNTNTHVLLPNEAVITGSKGSLKIGQPFWAPTKLTKLDKVSDFPLPAVGAKFNFMNSIGLSFEAQEVRRCLQKGLLESERISWKESLLIAEILESIRKHVGVSYPQDD